MKTMFISEKMQQDPSGGGGNKDEIRNKRRDDPHDKASNEVPFSNGVSPTFFGCHEDHVHLKEKLQQHPNGDGDIEEIRTKRRDEPLIFDTAANPFPSSSTFWAASMP
mmetsp:Transcript_73807/g.142737  ORF Transcript_73807/g.142737 Transcript_73807/m.142737 type:complete len:108 (-) Transcript_73807:13-336(-)